MEILVTLDRLIVADTVSYILFFCSAYLADGGKKMIVFGGTGLDGIAKDSLYIFHVYNNTWTTGASAGLSQARTNMACAVAGDSFIAWGGIENIHVFLTCVYCG